MRERFGEIQIFVRRNANHGVACDNAFLQSRNCNDRLDRRAWNVASREREFLIDH